MSWLNLGVVDHGLGWIIYTILKYVCKRQTM